MRIFSLIGVLVLLSAAGTSNSAPQHKPNIRASGNEFLEACQHVEEAFDAQYVQWNAHCLGWVSGFEAGLTVSDEFYRPATETQMTCIPQEVPVGQLFRIIKKYVEDHPERAHMGTRYLASEALIKAFPCKK